MSFNKRHPASFADRIVAVTSINSAVSSALCALLASVLGSTSW